MNYNVGMGAQFSENTVYTNKGFSSYNGLLVSLQKNLTKSLQFDINYTWSHSIDNVSLYANQIAFEVTASSAMWYALANAAVILTSTLPTTSPAISPIRCHSAAGVSSPAAVPYGLTN